MTNFRTAWRQRWYPLSERGTAILARTASALCIFLSLSILSSCQSSSAFNDTAFPYSIAQEKIVDQNVKRLVIAHVNFSSPSKKYLTDYNSKVDSKVIERLESGGYSVVDNRQFQKYWRDAVRKFGNPYNPVTSHVNPAAFHRVVATVLDQMETDNDVDAVVFTDLIERQIAFGNKLNRSAKWDGVSRRPRLKGAATALSQGFDWTQTVPAISLRLTIYHVDGHRLFQSVGGLEVSREIDTRKGNGRFVRREKLFTGASNVKQGVRLALHPFVEMKNYPSSK